MVVNGVTNWCKLFLGQPQRPDLEATIASGLFEECVSAVVAFAAAGAEGLHDTNHVSLSMTLNMLRYCRQHPGCEARIRSLAPALAFCLENDLDYMEQLGITSASYAAQICESPRSRTASLPCTDGVAQLAGCGVFGRDEGGSEFSFTQQQIDLLLERWSKSVRAVGILATSKPTADNIMVVELTISDKNKPLLLANSAFLPYLVDALLLVRAPSSPWT